MSSKGKAMGRFLARIRSYTLVELMVMVVIVAVIAGVAVPVYIQTVEKSKARTAKTVLLNLQGNERVYKSVWTVYLPIAKESRDNNVYWTDLKMDNPNVVHSDSEYIFWADGSPSSFTGKAQRINKEGAVVGTYEIDEVGTVTNPDGELPSP